MIRLTFASIAIAAASLAVHAAEPSTVEKVESGASSVATKTGRAIKKGGEKVEGAVEKGGSKVAEVAETTAKRTGEGVEKGVEKVKRGAKRAKAAVTPASGAK